MSTRQRYSRASFPASFIEPVVHRNRQTADKSRYNWQALVDQIKQSLSKSHTGLVVIVIDQSNITVDIHQHGTGNINQVGCDNISTLEAYGY